MCVICGQLLALGVYSHFALCIETRDWQKLNNWPLVEMGGWVFGWIDLG